MVGGLLHGTDVVIDTTVDDPLVQRLGGKDQVDAQPAPRLILEPTAAVVEPAEAVGYFRVEGAEAVLQSPALETCQPFAFLGEEAALAGAQPALGVHFANADIAVFRGNVEVAHYRNRLVRRETAFQQRLQIGVELG